MLKNYKELKVRFLYIAYGSNCEMETQILLSGDLGYIETGKLEILQEGIGEVERMLKALDPLNPRTLEPFASTNREKNYKYKVVSYSVSLLFCFFYNK